MFLKFANGTVASAYIIPFLIVRMYPEAGVGQKGFYDPVTNSLIQFVSAGEKTVLYQLDLILEAYVSVLNI